MEERDSENEKDDRIVYGDGAFLPDAFRGAVFQL